MLSLALNSVLCTFVPMIPFALQNELGPVVQKVDNAIHWINDLYPVDSATVFPTAYPALDSDLSSEWYHPTFQQRERKEAPSM